ncbi:MAG: bifunctional hydroxymethylpyrimidine kinase/phosphomethylpyrimidine kinase [Actinobacteria bacterium]|nr:bifunctional hydroxymethylpyrimidine kinase/phosphomethylpyrimidine kinase [Actinomycetota bacterium]
MSPTPPVVLVIAGSDSGGGAGVQADVRTLAAHGVFPTTALTALTAQNTAGVESVFVVPAEVVAAQIDAVLGDFTVRATKTGMLATAGIVEVLAARAATGALPSLVVDPVMVASSGDRLLEPEAERAYVERLFPHAAVITPNLREAAVLVGAPLATEDDMVHAARELAGSGAAAVLVKGGHLSGEESVDVLWDGQRLHRFVSPRVPTANVHGTGCSLASAIAAGLCRGDELATAVEAAKRYVHRGLLAAAGWTLGRGHGPIDHFAGTRLPGG